MGKNVLIVTVKPFAPKAVEEIKKIADSKGYNIELLESYSGKDQIIEKLPGFDAIIIRSDKIDEEIINSSNDLKIIVRAGAGYDNVDLSSATSKGIIVMNTPGQNSNAVAELALGMMVMMARNKYNGKAGTELRGKKIGIHAYGNVGKYVAEIAKGFGMEVYAFDPFIEDSIIENDGVIPVSNVEELYSKCMYVSLHIPNNEKTKKSINFELLSKMPAGATLVNTARKEVIDEDDLLKVFSKRDDFVYISDIAPDCSDKIIKEFDSRAFFTPKKMGAQTSEANVNAGIAAINQIINYFEKNDTSFQVNK